MALDHSLTHSLTHSILINLFIEVRLNSITFVPSAFYAYVWNILEGTNKANFFFPMHQFSRDGFCINGNILKNTDNVIC